MQLTQQEMSLTEKDVENMDSAIAAYISKIFNLKSKMGNSSILVYRGEARDFKETACQPNIFRNFNLDIEKNIEINILNTMSARKYAVNNSYFETAIEAQHGGFPSRLLDVTYNALVALFFAVTPHYTEKVTAYDDKHGVVYLFNIPKMYSPASSSVHDIYENLLLDNSPLRNEKLFSNTYKLLDHTSQNDRIIAQQGAFILFYGNKAFSLPERIKTKLEICPSLKGKIRRELSSMFNINMGSMYPEMTNNVDNILDKIKNINALQFSYANEIRLLINDLEMECEYRINKFISGLQNDGIDKVKNFDSIFEPVNLFKNYYKLALDNSEFKIDEKEKQELIKQFNEYVNKLHKYLNDRFGIQAPPINYFIIEE
ncbi:hypothetical protein MTP04_30010 [Lysinibacillus sp. PLM2]|nr:hypothetical protein MTP04_30010 [Lysinibacillus sp. PLM2]